MNRFFAGLAIGLLSLTLVDAVLAVGWCPNPGPCAGLGCGTSSCNCVLESGTWQCQETNQQGGGGGNP